jgi:Na+/melibiose symporter-like transporter
MIGDTVDYLEWKTGERAEGICFAMQTFINKIGMAIGAFVGVLAYYMSGISPSNPGGTITQSGSEALWAMLILTGAISMALTIIPMFFYRLTEEKQKEMVAEVESRKQSSAE